MELDLNAVVRQLVEGQYGHMAHRTCTAEQPMPMVDKDKYRWHHPDAKVLRPFFNLVLCECPHCKFSFTSQPSSPQQ